MDGGRRVLVVTVPQLRWTARFLTVFSVDVDILPKLFQSQPGSSIQGMMIASCVGSLPTCDRHVFGPGDSWDSYLNFLWKEGTPVV